MREAATGALHLITSKTGRDGSIPIHRDADLYLGKLDTDQSVTHTLAPDRHAWLHVAEGEVTLNGRALSVGDAVAVSDERALELRGTKASQVLLFDLN
jgi:redox-sensitive bicupin YhaK (pirin superfamily)